MSRADPFTMASPSWVAAQRGVARDRRIPLDRTRHLMGHMPDPRVPPAWMQPQAAVPDDSEPIITPAFIKAAVIASAGAALLVAGLVAL